MNQDNLAQQFDLEEGRIGSFTVSLPEEVEDVAFNPVGSRVYFRTARWIHRASSSADGLIWLDAIFGPKPAHGGSIIISTEESAGNEIYLPVTRVDGITLSRLLFDSGETPGLFGNPNELIQEWRGKLGMTTEARWGSAASAASAASNVEE